MCGIAGLVTRNGSAPQEMLERMASQLQHRGPEDTGHYLAEGFGIAHTRLAIIDIAGGHQPLFDESGRYALVCNGEIYNFVELRRELEAEGCRFLTNSDSEVALHAYARWGREGFARLNGMFAFALYDHQARELWLVRDRFGIKPLFYAETGERLLFGSEIKALVAGLPGGAKMHAPALAQYFQRQYSSGEETIAEGVKRLGPGEALRVDAQLRLERHRWYRPQPAQHGIRTFEQAVEAWEPLFEQVMREHMRSDVPFGMFLSGGVDSAVVMAMLKRMHAQPISSYSIGFSDTPARSELPDAQRVADLFGTRHNPILTDVAGLRRHWVRAVWAADDLIADHACLPTVVLSEAAAKELKVVFTGEGGDEAFAGYARFRPNAAKQALKRLTVPSGGGYLSSPDIESSWTRQLFREDLQPHLGRFRQPVIDAWNACPREWRALQKRQAVDLATMLADDLLVKVDRSLMASSMEGRVPFLDHRVMEFGLGLPDDLKIEKRSGKIFLKRWAERLLPADHIWQPKRGFTVPINLVLQGEFLQGLEQRLPQNEAVRQWCKPEGLQALLKRQRERGDMSLLLWRVVQMALWQKLFVAAPGSTPAFSEDPLDWL